MMTANTINSGNSDEPQDPQAVLDSVCLNLSRGIHAAAQPLTILSASLSKECTNRLRVKELRELIQSSASEVQRVCDIFHSLKELVHVVGEKPELTALAVSPLLDEVVERADFIPGNLEDGEAVLNLAVSDDCPRMVADRERCLEAVSIAVRVIRSASRANDTIEIGARGLPDGIHIHVRNSTLSLPHLNAEKSLGMAVVEAAVRSQRGSFSLQLEPLSVDIRLPAAEPAGGEVGR